MATRIIIKHRSVTGTPPSASDLAVGELALNTADGTMFTKHTNNSIVVLGGTGTNSISNNAVTLPKLENAARGSLITFDENQNATHFSIGSAGTVLKSNGSDIVWASADSVTVALEDSSTAENFVVTQNAAGELQRSTALKFIPASSKILFTAATSFIGDSSTTGNNLTLGNSATITLESPTIDLNASTGLDLSGAQLATNWTVATDKKIQFRNTSTYINSSADTILDLVSTSTVKITSPIIDLDASTGLDLSGAQLTSDWTVATNKKIQFRNTSIYINSSTANTLDIVSSSVAITGNLSVSGTLNAAASQVVLTATNNTNASHFIPFVDTATGNKNVITDSNFTYNPSTGTLSTTNYIGNIVGDLTGNLTGNVLGKIGNTTPDTGDFTTVTSSSTTTATGGFIGNLSGNITSTGTSSFGILNVSGLVTGSGGFLGNLDGIVGASTPAAGTFTDLGVSGEITGDLVPSVNASTSAGYNLGSATKKWKGLFVSGDTINLGDTELKASGGGLEASGLTLSTGAVSVASGVSASIYDYSFGTRATSRGDSTSVGTFNWYQVQNDHTGTLPTPSIILDTSKNLTISNNATISGTSTLTGAATLSNTLAVTGATTLGDTLNVIGTSTLAGLSAGTTNLTDTLTVTGATTLSNNATVGGTLGVTGASTLAGLTANATSITSTLGVAGTSTLANLNASTTILSSTLSVFGNTTLSALLNVTGATTLQNSLSVGGTFLVNQASTLTGNTTVGGTLGVTGATTLSDTLSAQATTVTTLSAQNTDITGTLSVSGNTTIGGNLIVNGATTTVNSTIVTIDDPIFTLGGDTAPTSNDAKDRGIEFRWHDGTNAKIGFFGMDNTLSKFKFIPDPSVVIRPAVEKSVSTNTSA